MMERLRTYLPQTLSKLAGNSANGEFYNEREITYSEQGMKVACAHQNIKIIPNKVLFSILKSSPRNTRDTFYFSVESDPAFQYRPFFGDFGPPSIAQLYSFARLVDNLLDSHSETLHFYTSPEPKSRANSCLYIAFFRMIHLNTTPESAFNPIKPIAGTLRAFRDASTLPLLYDLTVLDCLRGIHRAIHLHWFDYSDFDPVLWEKMEKIENGDMNWIIPGKLLALASPYSPNAIPSGSKVATAQEVMPVLKQLGITHVVRLNKQFYDASVFRDAGFHFTELYFPDGAVPNKLVLDSFMRIIESNDIVAIHCKAGLGRTGTLAGCYLIRNFGFTDKEAIGWIRVCRPGSVIGQQQQFLAKYYRDCHSIKSARRGDGLGQSITMFETMPFLRMALTPQKGFRVRDETMVDAYSNNPKFKKPAPPPSPRPIKWAPVRQFRPIHTQPLPTLRR